MIRLPDLSQDRHTIVAFDAVGHPNPTDIRNLTDSTGCTYQVSDVNYNEDTGGYVVIASGWGNCFDNISDGMVLRTNTGATITVSNLRYITKGTMNGLSPGEVLVLNHMLGPDEPNRFIPFAGQ